MMLQSCQNHLSDICCSSITSMRSFNSLYFRYKGFAFFMLSFQFMKLWKSIQTRSKEDITANERRSLTVKKKSLWKLRGGPTPIFVIKYFFRYVSVTATYERYSRAVHSFPSLSQNSHFAHWLRRVFQRYPRVLQLQIIWNGSNFIWAIPNNL